MAVNVLGRAYIEVHADTSPFARELEKDIATIASAAEKQSGAAGQRIGKGLGEGIEKEARRSAPRVSNTLFRAFGNIFRRGGNRRLFGSSVTTRLATEAAEVGTKMGVSLGSSLASGASSGISAVGKGITGLLSAVGSSVGNVGSAGPFALILGALIVFGIPALIGAVISLISVLGPLLNLLFLIPAALGAIAAAIIPVVVAFDGFGELVQAFASGDAKQIQAALKGMGKEVAQVAKDVASTFPFFKQLQKLTQAAFFGRIGTTFSKTINALKPILNLGFAQVARAAGEFTANLLKLAASPEVKTFFAGLFRFAAGNLFGQLGGALLNFLRVMAVLGAASLPALAKLTAGFSGMINQFATWIEQSIQNGDFDVFMEKLFSALDSVGALISSTATFVKTIIGGPAEQALAQSFFNDIIRVIDDLSAFFASEDGKRAITAMIILAKEFLFAIEGVLLLFFEILAVIDRITDAVLFLVDLIPGISLPGAKWQPPRAPSGTQSFGAAPHADGGDFNREHLAWISEGNKRELVIPMTDPARARDIAARSGLSSMIGGETTVNVYVGNEKLMSYVDKGVQAGLGQFGRAMKYGPRTVGVGA